MATSKIPCWQCRNKLAMTKEGVLIFEEVTLPGGNKVRVHKICKKDVLHAITSTATCADVRNGWVPPKRVDYDHE